MKHNIICIDPSLTCTAVIVNDKKAVFVKEELALSKTGKPTKWFEATDDLYELHLHTLSDGLKLTYTEGEVSKLCIYDGITYSIMKFIFQNIDVGLDSKVYIEGYSYSSAAGPLIDLVTFGGMLRLKLYTELTNDITIIAPTSLKLLAAQMTYPVIQKGKKQEWRNNEGVSGGSFTKPDMYKALIENQNLQDPYMDMLRNFAVDILTVKPSTRPSKKVSKKPKTASIPKPIEDLNDAKIMYEVALADK